MVLHLNNYDIKAVAQDPFSLKERTDYAQGLMRDMAAKRFKLHEALEQVNWHKVFLLVLNPVDLTKKLKEELEVHMQLDYKQSVEIAEEEVINNVLAFNKYHLINKRVN